MHVVASHLHLRDSIPQEAVETAQDAVRFDSPEDAAGIASPRRFSFSIVASAPRVTTLPLLDRSGSLRLAHFHHGQAFCNRFAPT
jgi:hypothetical protein